MKAIEMVIAKLKEIGADGLCNNDCGCGLDDIAPCGNLSLDCEAAKAGPPTQEDYEEYGIYCGDVIYRPVPQH